MNQSMGKMYARFMEIMYLWIAIWVESNRTTKFMKMRGRNCKINLIEAFN
jgi:hypothetical protein